MIDTEVACKYKRRTRTNEHTDEQGKWRKVKGYEEDKQGDVREGHWGVGTWHNSQGGHSDTTRDAWVERWRL